MSSHQPDESTADPKWSDDTFLDRLGSASDPEADAAIAQLRLAQVGYKETARLFAMLDSGKGPLPPHAPQPLHDFLESTRSIHDQIAPSIDRATMERGCGWFRTYVFQNCIVMLAASLPAGYSAPRLCDILTISDNLQRHPYRRLLGVVQLLVNIAQHSDHTDDTAFVTAQKMRLLHAGVRAIVHKARPKYRDTYGIPVSHEDMLATIMGFSLLVHDGCCKLGVEVSDEDTEAYWYVWRQFARMVGIFPQGEPLSEEFVPQSMVEARAFYDAYMRRHFASDPQDNPSGVALTRRNLEMMRSLIPWYLKPLGFGRAPLIAMQMTLGVEGMERVGLAPLAGHEADRALFDWVLRLLRREEEHHAGFFSRFGAVILQGMIEYTMGGKVTFLIPDSVEALQSLVDPDGVAVDREV